MCQYWAVGGVRRFLKALACVSRAGFEYFCQDEVGGIADGGEVPEVPCGSANIPERRRRVPILMEHRVLVPMTAGRLARGHAHLCADLERHVFGRDHEPCLS